MLMITGKLANILMRISKYGYDEPLLIKDTNNVEIKAMSTDRTTYFITIVRDNITELPERVLINLPEAIFNKNTVIARDVIEDDVEEIGEPDVKLTTIILAKIDPLLEVLDQCKSDQFSTVMLKPNGNQLVMSIRYEYYDEPINHPLLQCNARILEGNDIGMFRCNLLHRQLKFLKSLGISTIKMQYALKLPALITPYAKEYPRLWVAPYVGDE